MAGKAFFNTKVIFLNVFGRDGILYLFSELFHSGQRLGQIFACFSTLSKYPKVDRIVCFWRLGIEKELFGAHHIGKGYNFLKLKPSPELKARFKKLLFDKKPEFHYFILFKLKILAYSISQFIGNIQIKQMKGKGNFTQISNFEI